MRRADDSHAGPRCGAIPGMHQGHAQFLRDRPGRTAYIGTMTKLDASQPTRTLTIELPESEWAALRSVEPDAVGWLQGRIRERLRGSADAGPARRFESSSRSPSESYWGADEY
jgi:hypothetical protein